MGSGDQRGAVHVRMISRIPERAQSLAPEVKLTFLRELLVASGDTSALRGFLTVTIPLFVNKDPSNPAS
tara:strand:+ start:1636 stop:1842 length:207 start_codon:yes stop_codon:yes gene_type:complete